MGRGVAEHVVRTGPFGGRLPGGRLLGGRLGGGHCRLRVDLHGVSIFGPGSQHVLIRWEWVERVTAGDGVVVASATDEVRFPAGAFALSPQELADRLERARSIVTRADMIAELAMASEGEQ